MKTPNIFIASSWNVKATWNHASVQSSTQKQAWKILYSKSQDQKLQEFIRWDSNATIQTILKILRKPGIENTLSAGIITELTRALMEWIWETPSYKTARIEAQTLLHQIQAKREILSFSQLQNK